MLRIATIAITLAAGTALAAAAGSTINLTSQQQQTLAQDLSNQPAQQAPANFTPQVGEKSPSSLKLQQLPSNVTGQMQSLQGKEYSRLDNGQIIIVNPSDREIVAVVHSSATGSSSSNTSNTRTNGSMNNTK